MQETRIRFLGQEDPLKKKMATHSSILPGKFCEQRSLAGYSSWGPKSKGHNLATKQERGCLASAASCKC